MLVPSLLRKLHVCAHLRTRSTTDRAESLMHIPFCPDKPILAGFPGSFALSLFFTLAGRHDDAEVICLRRQPVNNPNPVIQPEREKIGVTKKGGILLANSKVPKFV